MITKDKIAEITDKIIRFYEPEKIILFGSCVNNHQNLDSDLDLILIKETKEPKHKRAVELRKKLFGTLVPIDLKIYSKDEFETESKKPFSFLNGALKNSSVLYEQ